MSGAAASPPETADRQWPVVITLKYPVDFGSERITQLEFRRGRMGDAKGLKLREEIPTNDLLLIASRMCGRPVAALELLDIEDGGEVTAIAMDFYVRYLGAGKTPSL